MSSSTNPIRATVYDPVKDGDSQLIKDWKKCKANLDPVSYLMGYQLQHIGPMKVMNTNPMLGLLIPTLIEEYGYTLEELLVCSFEEVRESATIYMRLVEIKKKERNGTNPTA